MPASSCGRRREEVGFPLARNCVPGYVARMNGNGRQTEGDRTEGWVQAVPVAQQGALHPERFCPNCSAELKESQCKLSCPRCGFYLSCSDFY
jgi:hypothetical protein